MSQPGIPNPAVPSVSEKPGPSQLKAQAGARAHRHARLPGSVLGLLCPPQHCGDGSCGQASPPCALLASGAELSPTLSPLRVKMLSAVHKLVHQNPASQL